MLYLSYDGVLEPLGRSQILGYLASLGTAGVRLGLLSFEKPADLRKTEERVCVAAELRSRNILWIALPYHRRPRVLATAWDLLRGTSAALTLARRHRPAVVHARSYVAGLIGLFVKTAGSARFVFDMRGFWPEERVELGLFRSQSFLYRASKLVEKALLSAADHIVVLTESAKAILREREARARLASRHVRETPITVIPCCTDLGRYRPRPRDLELARANDLASALVLGNVGAVNRRYMVPEMFRFAFHVKAHRPDLRFVYLTAQDPAPLFETARAAGLRNEDLLVLRVDPADVPQWLSLFRLGVFFLRPSYAAKASSFTKLGEFLASGVPVVTNTGVGDLDRLLASDRCGLLLPGLTDRDLCVAARKALPLLEGNEVPEATRRKCRETAMAHFALEEGVRRYRAVYHSLAPSPEESREAAVAAEV